MSDNFLIAVGGSGIKCLESLVHLAAIGTFNPDGPVHIAVVDADKDNGNLTRLKEVLRTYTTAKSSLYSRGSKCFSTVFVESKQGLVWSPLVDARANTSLEQEYASINGDELSLFEALYCDEERNESLNGGFRGHPAIGSLLFAKNIGLDKPENFWYDFCGNGSELNTGANPNARIFVVGSIFGGTGASGLPVLIRKIYDHYKTLIDSNNVRLGSAFLLPYFNFITPKDDGRIHAESNDFAFNSQCALRYYDESKISDCLNELYVIGSFPERTILTAVFGSEQKNPAMLPEVVAACSICNYFDTMHQFAEGKKRFCVGRADANTEHYQMVSETPLPLEDLLAFSRGSIAAYHFLGEIRSMSEKAKFENSISWFPKYFPNANKFSSEKWHSIDTTVAGLRGRCEIVSSGENEKHRFRLKVADSGYFSYYLFWLFDAFIDLEDIRVDEIIRWISRDGEDKQFSDLGKTAKYSIKSLRHDLRDRNKYRKEDGLRILWERIYKAQ